MSTQVQMVAYTTPDLGRDGVEKAQRDALQEIRRLEDLLSSWKQSSDVSRLNSAEGRAVQVSSETMEVFRASRWIGELSGGAFDVTFQVLGSAWKFGDAAESVPRLPARKDIEELRRWIDFRKVRVDEQAHTLQLTPPMKISFGGIAKGFIVDRAAAILRQHGLRSFFVQAGGDLLSVGTKSSGEPWRSGIQDPRGNHGEYFAVIDFSNHAFSTAGDYARSYVVDGRRYHHIIDPKTGYPATKCRSVTVWAPDALTADALDDAVFVLGPERGLELIESLDGVGAVIVDAKNDVIVSKRLASKLEVLRPPTDGL